MIDSLRRLLEEPVAHPHDHLLEALREEHPGWTFEYGPGCLANEPTYTEAFAGGCLCAYGPQEDVLVREHVRLAAVVLNASSAQAAAHRLLAEQTVQSQAILDLAVDAILTIDEKGTVLSANRAVEQMFGFRPEDVVGHNVSILMPEPYRTEHDAYIDRYLKTRQPRIIGIGRQVTGRRKDGSLFPAHLAVTEIVLENQRRFTGFLRDISDLLELRSEISRRETEFAQREEEVRTSVVQEERKFLSRELHDSVSQALFGIVLGTQAALNALETPERAREALDYVLSLAESGLAEMRALILELRPESLESEGLTGSLARQVKALARRYRLELELELGEEPSLPVSVKHEAYRLAMEAMHNVVKHAQASRLMVRVRPGDGRLWVEVEDDGIGFIPAEVPSSRVGLQSMRERVEQLKGELQIRTGPGRGTAVRASLPMSQVPNGL